MSPIFEISEKAKCIKRTAQMITEPLQVIPEDEELIIISANTGTPSESRQLPCSACPPPVHLSPSRTHDVPVEGGTLHYYPVSKAIIAK